MEKFHCTECEKDFKPTDGWECMPGVGHKVASKRYYMADAPTVREWRDGMPFVNKGIARTQILNIPPEKKYQEGGETIRIPGGTVEFVRGLFETTDPEVQFHLNKKGGLCSEEEWRAAYLNDDERLQLQRLDLNAREQRLVDRENELLTAVKARK